MISNREIKGQIDELTEQHQFLSQELQEIKELLQNQKQSQGKGQGQGQSQGQSQGQDQGQGQGQSQGQDQGQNQSQDQGQQDQGQSNSNSHMSKSQQNSNSGGSSQQQNSGSSNQIFEIANDFLKLKDLTNSLEKKMQEFSSSNSNSKGSLTDEDVINLVLNMMNGMIDWTMDFASRPKQQQGNQQSQLQ